MHVRRAAGNETTAKQPVSSSETRQAVLSKWWDGLHRSIIVQLAFSILMQVSYVAFPAYNFAIALWCLVCCTPKWFSKNPRLTLLVMGAVAVSIVTDVVWLSLWVSGHVFYDQFCGKNGVSIVSCGGASDYFPGCTTNRFALFAMLMNDVAKVVTLICIHRIRKLQTINKKNASEAPARPNDVHQLPPSSPESTYPSLPRELSSRTVQGKATDHVEEGHGLS